MNARTISLLLMAVNLGLAATLAYMVYSITPGSRPLPLARNEVVTNTVTQIAVRKINATNLLLNALASRPWNWQGIESTNYFTYIENLRNFSCPEETIRDIILTDIAKLYGRRRAAIRAQTQGNKFWLPQDAAEAQQARAQLRELEKEEQDLVQSLLGVNLRRELARYSLDEDAQQTTIAFLSPEKQDRVLALQEKYADLELVVNQRAGGVFLDEDQEQLRRLQRAQEAELAQIMSPEELEEYQLRNSETATTMRTTLAGFQPTEDEFRKIFRLQKTFDDAFNQAFDVADENALALKSRAQQDAQAALNRELQKTLGQDRYAEYQRAQDSDYRTIRQLSERFELTADVANSVYDMKLAAERQKQLVELNPVLTEEQRAQTLAALAQETERSVAAAMGDNAYRAYARNGGNWINGLSTPQFSLAELNPQKPPPTPVLPPELRNFLLNPPVLGNPPPVQVNPSPIGK